MILFNLVCSLEHEFEGWFRDGAAYDNQAASGALACPVCGDTAVRTAVMAPSVVGSRPPASKLPGALRVMLSDLRRQVEGWAENVGAAFPEEARRMHYGEAVKRPIYGDATAEEAETLRDEGIEVVSIPWLPNQDS